MSPLLQFLFFLSSWWNMTHLAQTVAAISDQLFSSSRENRLTCLTEAASPWLDRMSKREIDWSSASWENLGHRIFFSQENYLKAVSRRLSSNARRADLTKNSAQERNFTPKIEQMLKQQCNFTPKIKKSVFFVCPNYNRYTETFCPR